MITIYTMRFVRIYWYFLYLYYVNSVWSKIVIYKFNEVLRYIIFFYTYSNIRHSIFDFNVFVPEKVFVLFNYIRELYNTLIMWNKKDKENGLFCLKIRQPVHCRLTIVLIYFTTITRTFRNHIILYYIIFTSKQKVTWFFICFTRNKN